MSTYDALDNLAKRSWADELLVMLGVEWDHTTADDADVYEAIEAMGYRWYDARQSWLHDDFLAHERQLRADALARSRQSPGKTRKHRNAVDEQQLLAQWNTGAPIAGRKQK